MFASFTWLLLELLLSVLTKEETTFIYPNFYSHADISIGFVIRFYDLSTTATLATEESGRCEKVAAMRR